MTSNKYSFEEAKQAYAEERYEDALMMFNSLLAEISFREPELVLWLGESYYKIQDLFRARKCCTEVIANATKGIIRERARQLLVEIDNNYANINSKPHVSNKHDDNTQLHQPNSLHSSNENMLMSDKGRSKSSTNVSGSQKQLQQKKHQTDKPGQVTNKIFNIHKFIQSFDISLGFKFLSLKSLNLRTKATILAIALGVLPVGIIGLLAYHFVNQSVTSQIKVEKQAKALAITDKINSFLFERYGNIQNLASLSVFNKLSVSKGYTLRQKQDLLTIFSRIYGVYDNIAVFDAKGNLLVQTPGKKLDNYSDRRFFQTAISTTRPVISSPEISRSSGTLVVHFVAPVKDVKTGQVVSVITARVSVRFIEDSIREFGTTGDRYYIVDEKGKIFIAQERQYLSQNAQTIVPNFDELKANNQLEFKAEIQGTADRSRELVAYAPVRKLDGIPQVGWSVLVTTEARTAFSLQRQLLLTLLIGTVLTALSATVLAVITAKRGTDPLITLVGAVKQLGQGDLDTRVPAEGKNELAELGKNINLMADRIQSLVSQQQIETEYAQQLSAITINLRQTLNFKDTLDQVVRDLQKALKVERVIICKLNPNTLVGEVKAEAVAVGYSHVKELLFNYPELSKSTILESYKNGKIDFINDIDKLFKQENYCLANQQQLKELKVKAMAAAPIVINRCIYGFLIAYYCIEVHTWSSIEINLFKKIKTQIDIALEYVNLFAQVQEERSNAESARQQAEDLREQANATAEEQRKQKELIQSQLAELQTDVVAAARGDLTVYSRVGDGEIGIVADLFNSIVESLREIVIEVKSASSQVNTSVIQDGVAICSLAHDANQQSVEINNMLRLVEQMTTSIQELAENARQAAEVAQIASEAADIGGTAMAQTVESIFVLRETVVDTSKKVKRLGEASQQISNIGNLINEIALQTKVLAVNASIEAARSGEENKFAVIAQEVTALASSSANATKEIEQIVESIQMETCQVVSAMDLGTSQVVEGTKLAANAKEGLSKTVNLSHQINKLLQSISDTTLTQAETSQIVTKSMQQNAQVSEDNAKSAQQVSHSLQQTVETTQKLQSLVGKFKVESETYLNSSRKVKW